MNSFDSAQTPFPPPSPLAPGLAPSQEGVLAVMFSRGFDVFRCAWVALLVTTIVFVAVQAPIQIASMAVRFANMPKPQPGQMPSFEYGTGDLVMLGVTFMFTLLVFNPLFAGGIVLAARVSRGGAPEWNDLFAGFRRYGSVVMAGIVQMFAIVLATGVGAAIVGFAVGLGAAAGLGAMTVVIAVVLALALVPLMVWISVRLYFSLPRAADPEMPAVSGIDAVRASWYATKGHAFQLFIGVFAAAILAGLSILLLCVGYILVGVPLMLAIYGSAYDEVMRHAAAKANSVGA